MEVSSFFEFQQSKVANKVSFVRQIYKQIDRVRANRQSSALHVELAGVPESSSLRFSNSIIGAITRVYSQSEWLAYCGICTHVKCMLYTYACVCVS